LYNVINKPGVIMPNWLQKAADEMSEDVNNMENPSNAMEPDRMTVEQFVQDPQLQEWVQWLRDLMDMNPAVIKAKELIAKKMNSAGLEISDLPDDIRQVLDFFSKN
jgi:hypothetical protein